MHPGQDPLLAPGQVVAGRYRVLEEVGRGGMGVVYAAEHVQLPQRVALKVMLHAFDEEARARFQREAELVVQLRSQHVGRVVDLGELDRGEPFLAMEWLDGMDLDRWLETRGPLAVADAVGHVIEACEALAEAHLLGVVHRDLKPANLFLATGLAGERLIKVLDFGIAKAPRGQGSLVTKTGAMLGTPFFMAPEQLVDSGRVDARADIWGLGATLYQLLTGVMPFERATLAETQMAILRDPPPPMAAARGIPAGLEAAVRRCLEKDPWGRYGSVGDLVAAIEPWAHPSRRPVAGRVKRMMAAHGETVVAPTPEPLASAPREEEEPPTVARPPTVSRAAAEGSRSRMMLVGGLGALMVVVGVAALGLMLRGRASQGAAPVASPTAEPPLKVGCFTQPACREGTFIHEGQVMDEAILHAAGELARELAHDAELTMLHVAPLYDGRVPKMAAWEARPVFAYYAMEPGRPAEQIMVRIYPTHMVAVPVSAKTKGSAVEAPTCRLGEVLRRRYEAGGCGPDDQAKVVLHDRLRRSVWSVSCAGEMHDYAASDCALVSR